MPRKNPYSGKQKKQQLKDRKVRKQDGPKYLGDWSSDDEAATQQTDKERDESKGQVKVKDTDVQKINLQPETRIKGSVNSFRLHFLKEPDEIIERRKKEARRPFRRLCENELEHGLPDAYPAHMSLDFPKRPPWNYDLSKGELEAREQKYFQGYLSDLMSQEEADRVSYFDLNLENWRQLWRVLEISDILLIIADIRYPVLHLSPALLSYVQGILGKPVIIVLNKIDFVPPVMAMAWKQYLQTQFPGVFVVFFSSFVRHHSSMEDGVPVDFDTANEIFRKPPKGSVAHLGPEDLYKAVSGIVKNKIDLSSWKNQLQEEGLFSFSHQTSEEQTDSQTGGEINSTSTCDTEDDHQKRPEKKDSEKEDNNISSNSEAYKDGFVTIGCIGYPNVGKSSVLNTLKGKKVVSVSQTPGHTKHLQTIFLSPTVRLCDCPGLVFPSVVPKALQVIAGIFPVAQVREPYSVVQFLAERIDLPALLKIKPQDQEMDDESYRWSANDICEAFAVKCGFLTPKAARPDLYRAANKILRMAVEGQLRLCLRPPQYSQLRDGLKSDPETQALHTSFLRAGLKSLAADNTLLEGDEDDESDEDSEEEDDEIQ